MNIDELWRVVNLQDKGDLELMSTLPNYQIDDLLSIYYPAQLLRFAADAVGTDNELARRLVARAMALISYECKRKRLKDMVKWDLE